MPKSQAWRYWRLHCLCPNGVYVKQYFIEFILLSRIRLAIVQAAYDCSWRSRHAEESGSIPIAMQILDVNLINSPTMHLTTQILGCGVSGGPVREHPAVLHARAGSGEAYG